MAILFLLHASIDFLDFYGFDRSAAATVAADGGHGIETLFYDANYLAVFLADKEKSFWQCQNFFSQPKSRCVPTDVFFTIETFLVSR
jgi:hypothetical protein